MIISLMFNICLADTETVGKNEVSKVSEVAPESTETSESVDQEKQDKFQELVQLAKDKLIGNMATESIISWLHKNKINSGVHEKQFDPQYSILLCVCSVFAFWDAF